MSCWKCVAGLVGAAEVADAECRDDDDDTDEKGGRPECDTEIGDEFAEELNESVEGVFGDVESIPPHCRECERGNLELRNDDAPYDVDNHRRLSLSLSFSLSLEIGNG